MTAMNTVVNFQFFNSCYSASNMQPSAAIDDCVDRMLHHALSLESASLTALASMFI